MSTIRNDQEHSGYKTVRQWALAGYLPRDGAEGIKLWANRNCQRGKFLYFSPNDVRPATEIEIKEFFAEERERRNRKRRERRAKRARWLLEDD